MIANVTLGRVDPGMARILGVISGSHGNGDGPTPKKLEDGLFESTHWNFDAYLPHDWDKWWDEEQAEGMPPEIGVCDSPEQFKERFLEKLRADPRFEYAVSFVRIAKTDQPSQGGWRWHKWGEYVGSREPRCEYIYDEPEIDGVYTFHVYRRSLLPSTAESNSIGQGEK